MARCSRFMLHVSVRRVSFLGAVVAVDRFALMRRFMLSTLSAAKRLGGAKLGTEFLRLNCRQNPGIGPVAPVRETKTESKKEVVRRPKPTEKKPVEEKVVLKEKIEEKTKVEPTKPEPPSRRKNPRKK